MYWRICFRCRIRFFRSGNLRDGFHHEPLELDEGYDPNYSAAVNICSAPTGILIPPSGPLILYSITAGGVSVAALFMGGYLTGALLGIAVAGLAIFWR